MGNKQAKTVSEESFKDFKKAVEVLRENTIWDEAKLEAMYHDNACQITKEIPRLKFEQAMAEAGLLACVQAICATPIQDGKGKLRTMHLNESVVRTNIVDTLWGLFDTDRSGSVSFEEFVIGLSLILKGTSEQKAVALFKIQDDNQDGVLTRDELAHSIKKTTSGGRKIIKASMSSLKRDLGRKEANRIKNLSRQMNSDKNIKSMVDEIFQGADVDKSDSITLNEFIVYSKSNPEVLMSIYRITGDMPM